MNKSLQQYYLNVMGMPQWQLKKTDSTQPDESNIIYFPAALADDASLQSSLENKRGEPIQQPVPAENNITATAEQINQVETEKFEPKPVVDKSPKSSVEKSDGIISQPEPEPEQRLVSQPEAAIESSIKPSVKPEMVPDQELLKGTAQTIEEPNPILPDSLQALNKSIMACSKCTKRVHGDYSVRGRYILNGSQERENNLLIVTDAPTEAEYHNGKLLMPAYEQLLMAIFKAVGITELNIFLTPVLKCSPSDNHSHTQQELQDCFEFLSEEINIIEPKVIVGLGNSVNHWLSKPEQLDAEKETEASLSLSLARTKAHNLQLGENNISLYTTFHPAFLYRNPLFKSKALEDWIKISAQLV